eukprot:6192176-Pleurochrysis_carterae.AAC.2
MLLACVQRRGAHESTSAPRWFPEPLDVQGKEKRVAGRLTKPQSGRKTRTCLSPPQNVGRVHPSW